MDDMEKWAKISFEKLMKETGQMAMA